MIKVDAHKALIIRALMVYQKVLDRSAKAETNALIKEIREKDVAEIQKAILSVTELEETTTAQKTKQ